MQGQRETNASNTSLIDDIYDDIMSNEGTYELCGFSFLKSPLTISCADRL